MRNLFVLSTVIASVLLGLIFGVSAATRVASLADASGDSNAKDQVTIDNFSFTPASLTVPVGTKVTWVNRDDVPHTVVSTAKKFSSRALDTDEQFSYTFNDPGTYEYFCSLHPKMTAKVIVQK